MVALLVPTVSSKVEYIFANVATCIAPHSERWCASSVELLPPVDGYDYYRSTSCQWLAVTVSKYSTYKCINKFIMLLLWSMSRSSEVRISISYVVGINGTPTILPTMLEFLKLDVWLVLGLHQRWHTLIIYFYTYTNILLHRYIPAYWIAKNWLISLIKTSSSSFAL